MSTPAARKVVAALRRLLPGAGAVRYDGSLLPPATRRWCGPEFRDDAYFVRSAEAEAERLRGMGVGPGARILDLGCGFGRLPIGLLRTGIDVRYVGLDVHRGSIDWCRRYIERAHPSFRFIWMDRENARYNPQGESLDAGFHLPLDSDSVDVAYAYSVASHLTEPHLRIYLAELSRVLVPGGRIFLTAFAEEGVETVAENPAGYAFTQHVGPLHVVRYERHHLERLARDAGLTVYRFEHGVETDGQSGIYLEKR